MDPISVSCGKIPQLFAKILRWSLGKFDFWAKFKVPKHSISVSGDFFWKNRQFFKVFAKNARFFFKNQGFQAILDPISVSCGQISQLFATRRVKPLKILKNQLPFPLFLAILPFSDPIFTNFLPQGAWSLENFEKTADFRRK